MKKMIHTLFVVFLALPFLAIGQNETSVASEKKWAMTFDVSTESNFYEFSSPDHSASTGAEITTMYTSDDKINAGFTFGANKDLTAERAETLNDTTLFVGKKLKDWNDITSLLGLVKVTLPTNETSRDVNTLRAGLTLSTALKSDLKSIHLKYVEFKYTLSGSLYFHKYTSSIDGVPNNQKRLGNTFLFTYSPFEKTAFSYEFSVAQKWTYFGRTDGPSYGNTLSVAQTLSKNTELDIGISNRGNVYKANGIDNNLSIYDSATATVFVEFIFQL